MTVGRVVSHKAAAPVPDAVGNVVAAASGSGLSAAAAAANGSR